MPPLLAVEPGSITDVPAEDLGNVWTVFTKCKENLKDGRRLENLSWRLWYREITANNSVRHHHYLPQLALPIFNSPPFTQPQLSSEVDTASELSEASTTEDDDDASLDQMSIPTAHDLLPTHAHHIPSPSSHAGPSHTFAADAPPATSGVSQEQSLSSSGTTEQQARRPAGDRYHDAPIAVTRANSDSSILLPPIHVRSTIRARRPSSFNFGRFMTAHVDVAEFKASALNRSPAPQPFSPELESAPTLVAVVAPISVDVEPPRTPPSTSHVQATLDAPTFAIIQPTPRPTPPDSPQVSIQSHRSSATLVVPNNMDRYFIVAPVEPPVAAAAKEEEEDETEIATQTPSEETVSQGAETPTITEPVPVDDPRKRKTFFFKESPGGGGQHSPNSDVSSSSTVASTSTSKVITIPVEEQPTVVSASPVVAEPPAVAPVEEEEEEEEESPAPVVKAPTTAKKGKEPVKHAIVSTRPGVNRTATGRGGRIGAGHARHHSTNVAVAPRMAPQRSKSAAVINLKVAVAALAPLAAVEEYVAPPKRSASSSRLPPSQQRSQSTASSSKTVMAPPPTKKAREPSPLRPQPKRTPSPRAPAARAPSIEAPKKRSQLSEVLTKQPAQANTQVATGSKHRTDAQTTASSDFETTDTEEDDSSWASDYSDDDEGGDDDHDGQATATGTLTKEAAVEAARQRDMFAKVPTRSYSDLANQQRRPGLLTSLFHPDPSVVPYPPGGGGLRAHNSAQNLGARPTPMVMPGTSLVQSRLTTSKSSAAVPLAAQVTVTQQVQQQPLLTSAEAKAVAGDLTAQVKKCVNPSGRPGYRLQGRPEGMEVESSDSEEDEADSVPLSKSVAQRKLEALAGLARKKSEQRQQQQQQAQQQPTRRNSGQQSRVAQLRGQQRVEEEQPEEFSMPAPSAPIGLPHPYNLPLPAPPATPRTTRRQMFATEMTESMRRQLMWERETNRRVMGGQYKKSNVVRKPPVAVYGNEDFHATGW